MTALLELRKLDKTSAGITLPKDDLVVDGIADPDADGIRLLESPIVQVDRVAPREFSVKIASPGEHEPDEHGIERDD